MKSKSLEQLENDYWKEESEFPTGLIQRCFEYRKVRLSDLTNEQIRLLISQKIGLKFLIGIALEILEQNIIAQGDLYKGDLLDVVSKVPAEFWNEKQTEFQSFIKIVELNSELIKTEFSEKEFDQVLERIKASVQHSI
jgi:hypothetical protein